MEKTKFLTVAITLILIILVCVTTLYAFTCMGLRAAQAQLQGQKDNEKTLALAKLFVEKVLQGQDEVSFDDRLKLENAVRDLNNQQIFNQWQKIVKSKSDSETQQNVGIFLDMLINNLKP